MFIPQSFFSFFAFLGTLSAKDVARFLIWFPPIINSVGMFFQIVKSRSISSSVGMSSVFTVLRYLTVCLQIPYLYFCDLPFAYRVMILPQTLLIIVLFLQQIYYAEKGSERDLLTLSFITTSLGFSAAMYYGFYGYGHIIGEWAGWFMVIMGAVIQLPQMYRSYARKSTHGYSIHYVFLSITAYLFDWSLAAIIGVPIQTHVGCARAVSFRLFELFQFYIYQKQ